MKNVKKILKNANNEKKLTCEKLSTRTSNTEVGENKKKQKDVEGAVEKLSAGSSFTSM